ncbi:hypothetical protein CYMTET_35905 [Cymbomonas tetramitiformis]|uniref:Uncharacterized protein n=1 Tax=Cymbomonas tetramitiformis TaxID=36881 RepID=A0AAE0F8A1_9CHLO|nr:hypothetical protein CYMTET_35905 [Cymbomonas tetramitiformis]
MSRRSARKRSRSADIPNGVHQGLSELLAQNEDQVRAMLDVPAAERSKLTSSELLGKLLAVMGQQQLNTEGLLGRFFPREVLADYAESV